MNLFQSVTSALDNTLASDPTAGRISRYQDYIFVALSMTPHGIKLSRKMKNERLCERFSCAYCVLSKLEYSLTFTDDTS